MRFVFALGAAQKWLAQGYREGSPIEKTLIWPVWAVTRGMFLASWPVAQRVLERRADARGPGAAQ